MSLQGDGRKIFGKLRSRFGSKSNSQNEDYDSYDQQYDDGYDNYEDYGDNYDDFGEYDDYADGSRVAGSGYEPYAPVTTRSTGDYGSYNPDQPNLITLEDVRASIQLPTYSDDDAPQAGYSAVNPASVRASGNAPTNSSFSSVSDATAPLSPDSSSRRSSGLSSLFESTTPDSGSTDYNQASGQSGKAKNTTSASAASSYNFSSNNVARSASASSVSATQDSLPVIRPTRYEDAEDIAKALQSTGAAIVVMKSVSEPLFTRILDFSFGAAYVLGATVECIGTKVFAITCGSSLSDEERLSLRNQGVL